MTSSAAIARTLADLGSSRVSSISIGSRPKSGGRLGQWLYVTVPVPDSTLEDGVEASWNASIAAGEVAEYMDGGATANLANVVAGCVYTGVTPSGQTVQLQGGFGDAAANQQFSAAAETTNDIVGDLQKVVAQAPAFSSPTTEVVSADGPAVVATVTATNNVTRQSINDLFTSMIGNPARFVGLLLIVKSPAGSVRAQLAASYRNASTNTDFNGFGPAPGALIPESNTPS